MNGDAGKLDIYTRTSTCIYIYTPYIIYIVIYASSMYRGF